MFQKKQSSPAVHDSELDTIKILGFLVASCSYWEAGECISQHTMWASTGLQVACDPGIEFSIEQVKHVIAEIPSELI